jgi:hypothetical protein
MAYEPTGARAPFHSPGRDTVPGFYGQLRHVNTGSPCCAVVGIVAPSADACEILLAQLPPLAGAEYRRAADKGRHGVSVAVDRAQLETLKAWLEPLRTDDPCSLFDCHPRHRPFWREPARHAIDGYEHSIDYGPRFELSVPYVDVRTGILPGFEQNGRASR